VGGKEAIGGNFQMQSEALGIRALPGRAGHWHCAELLATSLTTRPAVDQSPTVLILDLLAAKRNITSRFNLAWYSILLSISLFGEICYGLGEERKGKIPTNQAFPCESQPRWPIGGEGKSWLAWWWWRVSGNSYPRCQNRRKL